MQTQTSNTRNIEKEIIEFIAERLDVKPDTIARSTIFGDLKADSLDRHEIIMAIEEQYSIDFDKFEYKKDTNIGHFIDHVKLNYVDLGENK